MKKIIFLVLAFATFQVSAQVSTMPHSIGIGQATLSSIPLHINKNGEVARFQGASPYISFYEGGNWNGFVQAFNNSLGIGTKNSFDLNMYTDDIARFTINGSSGQAFAHQRFNALSGINLTGPLRVAGNNVGSLGDVLMSLGNGTPAWSSISQNPQIGFQVYLSTFLTVPVNTFTDLSGFIENFDDGNGFNPATGVYTAPSSGLYAFNFTPTILNTNPALDIKSTIRLYKNGATLVEQQEDVFKTDISYGHTLNKLFYVKLNTNDTVTFSFFQTNASGSSLVIESNSSFFPISGYKVY